MKALLVVDTDRVAEILGFYLKPLGFEIIRYRNPLKAMDNIDEVDPDAVICSSEDFPRHWKPLLQFIRNDRDRESCVFILLKGKRFSYDDAAKALHIGVNGVVTEDLAESSERARLQQILRRYISFEDSRSNDRITPSPSDRLDFVFSFPGDLRIITGKIETISSSGIAFKPDDPSVAESLEVGAIIQDCSIRAGDSLFSTRAKVVRTGRELGMEFSDMPMEDKKALKEYLESWPERSIRAESHK